jgi:hypothetical protein
MSNVLKKIDDILEGNDLTIVSYGLAPNPFGFCFERGEHVNSETCKELSRLLNGLSVTEEKIIKERYL